MKIPVVEIIQPIEMKGGRVFKVILDEVSYLLRVTVLLRNYTQYYRILLFSLDDRRVYPPKHNWRSIRKIILGEMLKKHCGMSSYAARLNK